MSESLPAQGPDWRPSLHFTAPQGWINDPNGLVRVGATWHLHYQYEWPRCWGHATSRDLFHWEHLPVALKPDALGDCWSGCTVEDPQNTSGFFADGAGGLVSIYTSQDEKIGQRISLASSSDGGVTWQTAPFNPVVKRPQRGCRDPKVFWDEKRGRWVMVLTEDYYLTFFTSPNLRDWTETGRFTPHLGEGVDGFECPDIFQLPVENRPGETKWILSTSYLSGKNFVEGGRGYGACAQRYFVGEFDGEKFTAENGVEELLPLGEGPDEYAAIVWPREKDGARRTLIIGWMNHWGYAKQIPTGSWQGNLTLPRELTLREVAKAQWRLFQKPVRELWSQSAGSRNFPGTRLAARDGVSALGKLSCGALKARLRLERDAEVKFGLFARESVATVVSYSARDQMLAFDRRNSGSPEFHPSFSLRKEVKLARGDSGLLELTIVVDRSTVEIFAGDGAVYLSGLTFPPLGADGVTIEVVSGAVEIEGLEVVDFGAKRR